MRSLSARAGFRGRLARAKFLSAEATQRMSATKREHDGLNDALAPSLPAVHALHLADAVRACNGPHELLLEELGQTRDALSEPSARIGIERYIALCERAVELTGEPGLGFVLGVQAQFSRFGSLGFAVMSAATLRDAIELIERFLPTVTTVIRYRCRVEGAHAVLQLEEAVPLGAAREMIVFALSTLIWQLGERLTGVHLAADVEFPFAEPAYFARFAAAAPGRVSFGASAHRVRFDRKFLDLPLVSADPAAARTARAHCERELQALEAETSLVAHVHNALFADSSGLPTPQQLARALGMAERTLKRRLAEHGTSYTQILEAGRRQRALELLATPASVDEIAERLGYSDAANFTRAFRRWTGRNPRSLRRELRRER
jgi:AraC-like DNA-binding protein